jgi:iron complex transport system ATP-binding protein
MTAVRIEQLVTLRVQEDDLWVEGFFTVGVTNAVRAGEPPPIAPHNRHAQTPGTINMILVTNAQLPVSAMVTMTQVATESKTAALFEQQVPSWTGLPGATGTGTDAIVLVCGEGPRVRYSGTHTTLGALVGQLVFRAIGLGLRLIQNQTVIKTHSSH